MGHEGRYRASEFLRGPQKASKPQSIRKVLKGFGDGRMEIADIGRMEIKDIGRVSQRFFS